MVKTKRILHPDFVEYQKMIISHPNYAGIPYTIKKNGEPTWLATAKTEIGKARIEWLDKNRSELGIPNTDGWRAKTALAIHPTKTKPCQVCGSVLSLDYVYPNTTFINKMTESGLEINSLENITERIAFEWASENEKFFKVLTSIFDVDLSPANNTLQNVIAIVLTIGATKKFLGPGAMSNFPDRLDGFHSYNRCCRSTEDKGRSRSNLNRYGQDRRAFENWSDGNWKAADRLMKEFSKHNVSADHIGPISLGFRHDPHFQPMTLSEQATKNNRMTYDDVQKLLEYEREHSVISWHSAPAWNRLKFNIQNDSDAKEASMVLRKNMHFILSVLAYIKSNFKNGEDFLFTKVLEKQVKYAYADYLFEDFDAETGQYGNMNKICKDRKEYDNNAKRYVRKAFEALDNYSSKDNRWYNDFLPQYSDELSSLQVLVDSYRYNEAFDQLNLLFEDYAKNYCNIHKRGWNLTVRRK